MEIDIVGAGIGGLSAAVALKRKGFSVRVFEQSPKFNAVGAGIIMASNAMQIFQQLGLHNIIEQHGNIITNLCISDKNLKIMQNSDLSPFKRKYGLNNVALHRADLHSILSNELNDNELFLDHTVTDIKETNDTYHINFKNKKSHISSFVVGADGIHSRIREQLFPTVTLRDANQECWRGVTAFDLSTAMHNQLIEAWGKGTRFGIVPIGDGKVYWYALKSENITCNNLIELFSDYNTTVTELITSTKPSHIHHSYIHDIKPYKHWIGQNVCLLGDAAHAMTPNLGQGACQGIEDAYVLTECLARYQPDKALDEYQRRRQAKAVKTVNTAWMVGKIAHQSNPFVIGLRNAALKLTPQYIQQKMLSNLFSIEKF